MVAYRLGTGEVPSSNPGKGENFSVKLFNTSSGQRTLHCDHLHKENDGLITLALFGERELIKLMHCERCFLSRWNHLDPLYLTQPIQFYHNLLE